MKHDVLRKLSFFLVILLLMGSTLIPAMELTFAENETVQLGRCSNSYDDIFFDSLMTLLMKIGHVPSVSACIIKENEVVWSKGYGLYDIEQGKSATETTLYNIASISKTITATALMQLYDRGMFQLDDDVNDYLPFSLRNPKYPDEPISFRMLLAHQSSLAEDPSEFYRYFSGEECPIPLYPWIQTYLDPEGNNYTSDIWSNNHPGEKFHYANVGFALIGYLVEQLSGQPFNQYCKENIFTPLDMPGTSFFLSEIDIERLAVPYRYFLVKYIPYEHYCYIGYPCGSVRTSVIELSHFLIVHMNGGVYNGTQILEEDTVSLMHTAQYPNGGYGLGWGVSDMQDGEKIVWHTGGDLGVATSTEIWDDVAVTYFSNAAPWRPLQTTAWTMINVLLLKKAESIVTPHNKIGNC